MPDTPHLIDKEDKPITVILTIPPNQVDDVWLHLLDAFVMRYAEPPVDVDLAVIERELQVRKSAVLAEYGLHLNV